mmetsp:Transcript_1630/g.3693  ORF Transcript_1630/g.3693 Transcript_1630/m.3693 type:complete len:506 (-) Transcript_1630:34-1551(-)
MAGGDAGASTTLSKEEAAAEAARIEARKRMEKRPVRPTGLRSELLRLHFALIAIVALFVALGLSLTHPVPEGKYETADGSLIDLDAFDPAELGPFPRCHPHHGEHRTVDNKWVKNSDVAIPEGQDEDTFDFPVGHPKNKAWRAKRDALDNESKLSFSSLQPSLHLLALSVVVVYLGCKHSVWLYVKPDPARDAEDDIEEEEDIGQSSLQDGDAYMFPILGSAVLFGLFLVYKYLDSEWIKFLFSSYVVLMCTNGLGINIGQLVALLYNSRGLGRFRTLFVVPWLEVKVTWIDVVAYLISCALGVCYIQTRNWIVNNIMGLSFCLLGLKHVGIATYKTGLIMLCGLFVYDVFWVFGSTSVFGSNVMVTVATGVQAPIKLMFPRSQDGCGNMEFSMLGLGDIVVPGVTISLLAKFDTERPDAKKSAGWTYLNWTMLSYALSLITTVAVMLIWNHAQPALLYIVPYIIASSFLTAAVKRQVGALMNFKVEDTMLSLDELAESDKAKSD